MHRVSSALVAVCLCLGGDVLADDPANLGRNVGRAGAALVSDDGLGALLYSPAALARRTQLRAQLALTVLDSELEYLPPQTSSPTIASRGSAAVLPAAMIAGAIGAVTVAFGVATTTAQTVALPAPSDEPAAEVVRRFPHRYAGLALERYKHTMAAAAATRLGSWLGVGVSVSLATVAVNQERTLWAGLADRDPVAQPSRDLWLETHGRDWIVPGLAVGVLIAPPSVPLELALAGQVQSGATLSAAASARTPITSELMLDGAGSAARLELPASAAARAGVRYLGERVFVEVNGELTSPDQAPADWRIDSITVRDRSGGSAALTSAPGPAARRTRAAVRTAVDLEVVSGFLWLTAGYAFASATTPAPATTPVEPGLAAHTLALGLEASWRGTTITAGYARSLLTARQVRSSDVVLTNPFEPSTVPVASGDYDGTSDRLGLTIELQWE